MKPLSDLKTAKARKRRQDYYDTLYWDSCVCLDCGRTWRASDDEHFNIGFCSFECNGKVDIMVGEKYESI